MNIFSVLANLYTNKKADWLVNVEPDMLTQNGIQPFLVQRWLGMNDAVRTQTRWLDKYVFVLTPKMYLSLAWSVLPKSAKTPYVKYIKQEKAGVEEHEIILTKVRKQYEISDNDFVALKPFILNAIENDKVNWFRYYGIPKRLWRKNKLDFNLIKEGGSRQNDQKGLEAWGI